MHRNMWMRNGLIAAALAANCALAACSGGGGTAPLPSAPPTKTPPATTPSVPTYSTAGTVVDLPYDGTPTNPGYSVTQNGVATPGAPIAGAHVYAGTSLIPGSAAPAAVPAGYASAVTAADGTFALTLPAGTYALTIFAPAPHQTIVHRDLVVAAGSPATTYYMTAPSAAESTWLAQENVDRAGYGASPVVFDEAVVEAGRYWAEFMQRNQYFAHCIPASICVSNDTTPAPAIYGPQDVDPQHRLRYFHGFSGASEGENIAAGFDSWQTVEANFMNEVNACPNAAPANCTFGEATGHFLNIINPHYTWSGFGIAALAGSGPYYDQEFALLQSTSPSVKLRSGMRLAR